MEAQPTDNDLLKQVHLGQKEAFVVLIQRYQQQAYKLALVILQNTADAEDAVSEAFYKAFKALPNGENNTNFKSWLLKITYHCALDILRKRKSQTKMIEKTMIEKTTFNSTLSSIDSLEDILKQETRQEVWTALKKLAPDERTALILKYYQETSYEEIAVIMNWPIGTVASRLYRAREKLRNSLKEVLT